MKALHDSRFFCWSSFDEARNIDFNSYVWVRDGGNVVFDPLPLSDHDLDHLGELGGAEWIVVTNSDHVRATNQLADRLGAKVAGPVGEKDRFEVPCARWLDDGDELFDGAVVFAMHGSKTPGELAILIDSVLITGDLVRAHQAGRLAMLPAPKLIDPERARASVARLAGIEAIDAVLVGDGWPVFERGHERLKELVSSLRSPPVT